MNEQTPQAEETPKKYHWGRFWIGILVVIGFLIVRGLFHPPSDLKSSAPGEPLSSFGITVLEKICIPVDYAAVCDDPDVYADEDTYIYVDGRIMKEFYSIGEKQMLCLAQDDNPEKLWFCSYSTENESGAVTLLPGDLVTVYGQFLEILTLKDNGTPLTLPFIAGFHVLLTEPNNALAAPELPETTVFLSAPEAEEIPETVPENTAPETEAPAEVIPLEPESPAETTLDEWFALVDARTHRSTYGDEEKETTLEEWFAKIEAEAGDRVQWYTVNTSTHVIHDSDNCYNAKQIKPENRSYTDDPYSLIAEGYTWCGTCHKVP